MLSIVIPTLNEEKFLPELLQVIKEQTFTDYEIIVSDAFSTDNTLQIARDNNCVCVLGDKNKRHPSIQRNRGAEIAKGDTLLFLDADTRFYDKDFLLKSVSDFNSRGLGIAAFYMDFKSKKFFYKFYYCFYNSLAFLGQYIKPIGVGAAILVKKEVHQKIKGYNESIFIGEDQFYCDQASKISKFRLIKKCKIYFSIRRFEKEGRWRLFFKIMYGSLYVIFLGPIKRKIIKYDFGKYN